MKTEYTHICLDGRCPYQGQPSALSCNCHLSREDMMLVEIGKINTLVDDLEKLLESILTNQRNQPHEKHS